MEGTPYDDPGDVGASSGAWKENGDSCIPMGGEGRAPTPMRHGDCGSERLESTGKGKRMGGGRASPYQEDPVVRDFEQMAGAVPKIKRIYD